MQYFDFHHHKRYQFGIYNLHFTEDRFNSFFSAGLHPKDIDENFEYNLKIIEKMANEKQCIAIGECGLDSLALADDNLQEKVFEWHIKLANQLRKPIIIHCVRRFSQILHYKKLAKTPFIIHGYNKKKSIVKDLLDAGCYISFGHAILSSPTIQNIVKNIPLDKIFLETDDKIIDIQLIYEKVAELKSISIENIKLQINSNLDTIGIKF